MSEGQLAQGAVISGIGISRIGRKTGVPGMELTLESAREAIADAGLDPSDIDGIASLGETPVDLVAERFDLTPGWAVQGGFGRYGLLTPVVDACEAVTSGRARHVLVYRTVHMLGGQAGGQQEGEGRRGDAGVHARHLAHPHHARVLGGELAGHASAAPHVPLRHDS